MSGRGAVAIVLVFMGIGLIVGGSIVLGTQTTVTDQARCGSSITADDRTSAVTDASLGPTCAIVRGTRSTGGTIALTLGISMLLAGLTIAILGGKRTSPSARPPGQYLPPPPYSQHPGPPPARPSTPQG
jgi:hypothetical protein